jgi:hypothetical protein
VQIVLPLAPPIFNSGSCLVAGFATAGNASYFGYAQQPLAYGYENPAFQASQYKFKQPLRKRKTFFSSFFLIISLPIQ